MSLLPRADADDGLVALASIVSKAVRELWMDVFNAHWSARIPDLRPTAGYPNDAIAVPRGDRALVPRAWARPKLLVALQIGHPGSGMPSPADLRSAWDLHLGGGTGVLS